MFVNGMMPDRYPLDSQIVRKPKEAFEPVGSIGILSHDKERQHSGERRQQDRHDDSDEDGEINTHGPGTGTMINVTG